MGRVHRPSRSGTRGTRLHATREHLVGLLFDSLPGLIGFVRFDRCFQKSAVLITRHRIFSSPFSKLKVSFLGKFEGRARVSWLVRSNDNLFPEIKTRADSSRSSFLLVLVVECTVVLRQHVKLRPFIMHPRYHLSVHVYVRFKI